LDDSEDLEGYDPAAFPPVAVTVDLVLMTTEGGSLAALLSRREEPPFRGRWALPGGFVREKEGLEEAARRVLAAKAHLEGAWIEQLYSFGAPDRDPRMRVVTVAYFALLPCDRLRSALGTDSGLRLAPIRIGGEGPAEALDGEGRPLPLAFDHGDILAHAVRRLRGKLDYTPVAFSLLPEFFTLRQLQSVHETILGRALNKPAFRRRMLDSGLLAATGEKEKGASYRPAELFGLKREGETGR